MADKPEERTGSDAFERTDTAFLSGGLRCVAWLYRPTRPAGSDARRPCVVLGHGFCGTRDARLDAYAERFAAAGFAALVFDYRHFGASEGAPRQILDIDRQLEDWAAAIAHARAQPDVDPERVALWGTSFSGGHVLEVAARDGRVAAVVSQVPFVDGLSRLWETPLRDNLSLTAVSLRDEIGSRLGALPVYIPAVGAPGTLAVMTTPDAEPGYRALIPPGSAWRNEVAARVLWRIGRYQPGLAAERLTCPLLVCVAEDDAITPAARAVELASRARQVEIRRYPGGHFAPYLGELFEQVVADQIDFLRRQLVRPGECAQ